MPTYNAPLDNMRFLLHDVFNVGQLAKLPGFEDATPDLIDAMLEEVSKFCENELQPLNQSADEEGCHFENGVVRTPRGFKEAYAKYCELGLPSLNCDPAWGGQGLPLVLNSAIQEMLCSANLSFSNYPGLTHGAYEALHVWGAKEQQEIYLPKLVSGEWSGTMCLTEPHCGTDLGMIRTRAEPNGDGSYAITGTKIFITSGEHDLTSNICHLVLAKLPDAPPGVKGISLFIVPKFLPKQEGGDWVPGPRNGAACGSIEHKMGIKGSVTCVMNFDGAQGWLVGAPHKGMRGMFTMMNAARLAVGIQGLGLAEVSYQNALSYAKDRLQGRALTGTKAPEKPADPIIVHPDVRKNLLTMKAITEGCRALALWTGYNLDLSHKHPDEKERQAADDLVALMTPIVKAYLTDMGLDITSIGVQIFGGHGYIREHGMEQFLRDSRITMLYEGANGIQALDLVGRKLPTGTGRLLRRFFHPAAAFIAAEKDNPALAEFLPIFEKVFGKLQQGTALLAQKSLGNPDEAGAASTDYLRIFALVALAYMWLLMVKAAAEKKDNGGTGTAAFYDSKIKTARFYFQKILPEVNARFLTMAAGAKPLMDISVDEF